MKAQEKGGIRCQQRSATRRHAQEWLCARTKGSERGSSVRVPSRSTAAGRVVASAVARGGRRQSWQAKQAI